MGQPDNTIAGSPICMGNSPCRPNAETDNPAPLRHDFRAGLVRAQWQASVDVVFTPFAGKMGLFSRPVHRIRHLRLRRPRAGRLPEALRRPEAPRSSKGLDTNPDSPTYCSAGAGQNQECLLHPVKPDEGVRVGGSFGGGIHMFIADWVSLNLEVQDIVVGVNHAGLNTTIDDIPPVVNNDDRDVFHNVTFQLGPKFYFPFKAKRTK